MDRVPMAAQDRLFPSVGRLSPRGVPALGIVLSALLATALVLSQAVGSPDVREIHGLVVSLSTMTAAVPYAFCALAIGLIAVRRRATGAEPQALPRIGAVEIIAFVFSMFTIYGCDAKAVLYGSFLLLLGIPVFVWQRRRAIGNQLQEQGPC